jgi:predicted ATPase/DNA-binding winged helix-turn-helix (wHTH) protein
MNTRAITFGPFRLLPKPGQLFLGDTQIRLGYRAVQILTRLIERAGDVVGHEELITAGWPDTIVEGNNLRVQISAIRKALRNNHGDVEYIYNASGHGYRFCANDIQHEIIAGPRSKAANLPAPVSLLIGREEVSQTIIEEVSDRRLVTIVGAGGIGKTSLAITIARQLERRYKDGVYFVDLAAPGPMDILETFGAALGIAFSTELKLSGLLEHLVEKETLLVVDNCEHVIERVSGIIEALVGNVSTLTVLATSREPLRVKGECVYRLAPLQCPPVDDMKITATRALEFPACRLFVERARATFDSFEIASADGSVLASICNSLDGIPLAIELAADLIGGFGLHGLADRFDDRLSVLARGRRTAVPRQHTLRATLDWSYGLLPEVEQAILRRLSVFKTEFTREAAIAVISGRNLTARDVSDGIANLVAKSLLLIDVVGTREFYTMLHTTRAYVLEKAESDPEQHSIRCAYAEHILQITRHMDLAPNTGEYASRDGFGSLSGSSGSRFSGVVLQTEHPG